MHDDSRHLYILYNPLTSSTLRENNVTILCTFTPYKGYMMKIAFFEIKEEERLFFQAHLQADELFFFETTINEALKESQEYDAVSVFVHSRIDDTLLDKLPKLQYIQTRSTGYEHLKCEMLHKRGVLVSNVAGYAGPAVGEFAFSLLLNATRATYTSLERTKKKNFEYSDLQGIELYGKTIGILGLGTIGSQMARIAKGFGMNIMVYSRTKRAIVDELGIHFSTLENVLEQSDVLMIALPLTPATKNILNLENAQMMKENAIIVNTARGEIIADALYEKMPNIFCLDVIHDQKYVDQKNILYTPHMAYYTKEALERIQKISLENMQAFIDGKLSRFKKNEL